MRFKVKPYTFSGAYDNLQIYVESAETAAPFASFYIDDASLQFMPPPVIENIPSIAQTYASDFLVGFATLQQDLLGPHGQLAALHYNSVTPGNDLKWDTTEPQEGNFNFTPGDTILGFAQAHNIKMRGHTFVWHNQVPAWVFQDANGVDMSTQPFSQANKQLLLSRLKNQTAPAARSFNAPMIAVSPRRMIADPNELARPVVGPGEDRRTYIFQLPDASRL